MAHGYFATFADARDAGLNRSPAPSQHELPDGLRASMVVDMLAEVQGSLDRDPESAKACIGRMMAMLSRSDASVETSMPAPPPPPAHGRGGLVPWQVRKVEAHIEKNLDSSLAVQSLASLVALSSSYFCRAFKSTFGEPPHAHIMRRRIQRAQKLMLETGDSLSDIALACGLSDQAHLSRLFRRIVGESPGLWRRANRARA
jgi:AraC-like DNA-binding protein